MSLKINSEQDEANVIAAAIGERMKRNKSASVIVTGGGRFVGWLGSLDIHRSVMHIAFWRIEVPHLSSFILFYYILYWPRTIHSRTIHTPVTTFEFIFI